MPARVSRTSSRAQTGLKVDGHHVVVKGTAIAAERRCRWVRYAVENARGDICDRYASARTRRLAVSLVVITYGTPQTRWGSQVRATFAKGVQVPGLRSCEISLKSS